MLKVAKFGGSSLASAEQIMKAAAIVKQDPDRRFVIASAPGKRNSEDTKVTDMLYGCYEAARKKENFQPLLEQIKQRYAEIIEGLGIEFDLDAEFCEIADSLKRMPLRDYMASRGEHINSKIIAKYLGFEFIEAADYVMFDEEGKFMPEETNLLLTELLEKTDYAVIPGFYGARADGTVKTFSRGGSDITGSIVARAAKADIYENWTDVSGVLAADPRIVNNPRVISYLSYKELRELSYMGASVLHEDAVFPVRKAGIPINLRNTNCPEDKGTMIVRELPAGVPKHIVTGVAGHKGFCSVLVEKAMMNGEIGFGANLLKIFAENGVSFEHLPSGIDTMSVVVNASEFERSREKVLETIEQKLSPDTLAVESGLALIAVVGQRMTVTKGIIARIFTAIANAGVNVRLIDNGSNGLSVIIGVDEENYEIAIRALYEEVKNLL